MKAIQFPTGSRVKYHDKVWTVGNLFENADGSITCHIYRGSFNQFDDYVPEAFLTAA